MFEYWIDTDTKRLPNVLLIEDRLFRLDDEANKLGVRVFANGSPVTISGDIEGWIIKGDGTSLVIEGDSDGNQAWVILPEESYDTLGKFSVFIKLLSGDDVITLGGFETAIYPAQTDMIIN